ncbi:MAG TPA: 6-phosphogluconolactonase [Tepidisphaeraceae bacterium]|jgi:6-phosphogluconolactonase
MPDIRVLPDSPAIARAAADLIAATAGELAARGEPFSLVLSGGSTPRLLYQLLAADPYRGRIDWPNVEIYFGDERAVPTDHPDSNFKMANEALLAHVPIKPENIHRMRGEIDPNQAAIEYGRMLKERFGDDGGPDITLLGMGDDGHTASLFPHTPAVGETRHRCVAQFVEHSTTGRSWRITLTAPFINRSAQVLALVTGASKAARLAEVLYGPRDPERLPIQLIQPAPGRLIWLIDQAAAAQLPRQS